MILNALRARRDALFEALTTIDGVRLFKPNSTFYLFPDITAVYHRLDGCSLEEFRLRTLEETGVAFCTREHFGTPPAGETRMFVRFAFAGISVASITEGIARLRELWHG